MSLEIRQHEDFSRRESRFERVGWLVLALFLIAGVLGLLGPGLLSSRTAVSPGGMVSVDYDAMIHFEADTSVTLRFEPEAVRDGSIRITMTGRWVGSVDLQSISPEPTEQSAIPNGMILELTVDQPGTTEMLLSFRAQEFGPLDLEVEAGGDSVQLSQFVWP